MRSVEDAQARARGVHAHVHNGHADAPTDIANALAHARSDYPHTRGGHADAPIDDDHAHTRTHPSSRFRSDVRGVTEQVDSILMVATTLVAAVAVVALLSQMGGPAPHIHADLAVTVDEGENGWGSGDESVTLRHKAGRALAEDSVVFIVHVGDTTTRYAGTDLGFQDGTLRIGDSWTRSGLTVPLGAKVQVDAIARTDSRTGADSRSGSVVGGTYLEELIFSGSATAIGAAPDLEIVIVGMDPAQPYVGGPDTRILADVTNLGNAPTPAGVPIRVAFSVDGVALGTISVPGPLQPGESIRVVSSPWTIHPWDTHGFSQVGTYTASAGVDPFDEIPRLGLANRGDTHLFSVARGTTDPGCAFHDSGDRLYTPGYPIDDQSIWLDGEECDQETHWVAPPGTGLVIPESVGDIENVNLYHVSGDANITIRVNLFASGGQVHIKTTNGSLHLDGISIISGGSIYLEMTKGSPGYGISAVGSTLVAGTYIKVEAKDGWVDLTDATLSAGSQDITVLANGGEMNAEGASFESGRRIEFQSTDVMTLEEARVTAVTAIRLDLTTTANRLDLSGTRIDDEADVAHVLPTGVTVIGTPSSGTWSH